MARGVAVIGNDVGVAQAAFTLAEMGIQVAVITSSTALGLDTITTSAPAGSSQELLSIWPLLLRAASHPLVTLYTNSQVKDIRGKQGEFTIRATRQPRYIHENLCTGCGLCEEVCSIKIPSMLEGRRIIHSAIHAPLAGAKGVPSAYYIEKNGIAPCRAACPLGINVQGFISLLARGKVDQALSLINEAAPLASVLGRVCTHPCEDVCKRAEVDSPVFIRALHRYAADNAPSGIRYSRKAPAGSRKEKIAIIGSGPAGLTAAWELARRGYTPTVFESHAVVGGMLATGIPRFRLPREVREREVEAIKALGVDIKTGITLGRDVTLSDLREREYRAFFIAIGAHQNNKLDIPGEDLEGVVDSISLLFALNLKVGVSVGSHIVVIGGGNSAVDSARTAKRQSKGMVRIIYRRTAEEMTAVKEDIEEAIKEGVPIEYLTAPVEILGDGNRVTGIRCQRMSLGALEADGRHRPEPIPGSEFVIEADHVVAAIGQRPNTRLLNIKSLEIIDADDTVKVDPLTQETNIPGVFAGGDCSIGPNNVVEAMAAGLRAAESIDRHLSGRDLREGRTMEKPQAADVNVKEREASHHRRARMPVIHPSKIMGSFEETTLGLPNKAAEQEASRCLNCALCSECLECERSCELDAVFHKDDIEQVDIDAEAVINFVAADGSPENTRHSHGQSHPPYLTGPGIYTINNTDYDNLGCKLARASAIALDAAAELKLKKEEAHFAGPDATGNIDIHTVLPCHTTKPVSVKEARVGVVLCRCGGSLSSMLDFRQVAKEAQRLVGVCSVQEVQQACSEEGARQIAAQATESSLGQVVLAACRCCNLDQICFSCTDRRIMCQRHLSNSLTSAHGIAVEFVNIREQCAWAHRDNPPGATHKAIEIISSGVARARVTLPPPHEERPVESSVLVLGAGLYGLAAARALATQGYSVTLVSGPESEKAKEHQRSEYLDKKASLLKQLGEQGINSMPWPHDFELDGSPGNYEAVLKYRSQTSHTKAGALILDLEELEEKAISTVSAMSRVGPLSRILARRSYSSGLEGVDSATLRGFTIRETAGIFIISPDGAETPDEQVIKGTATAAKASAYLCKGTLRPHGTAITIDSKLCRGCGDCAAICPYIEMIMSSNGISCAYVDPALCLGCGACIARCPTGAITQPLQNDRQIVSALEALFGVASVAGGVR